MVRHLFLVVVRLRVELRRVRQFISRRTSRTRSSHDCDAAVVRDWMDTTFYCLRRNWDDSRFDYPGAC